MKRLYYEQNRYSPDFTRIVMDYFDLGDGTGETECQTYRNDAPDESIYFATGVL